MRLHYFIKNRTTGDVLVIKENDIYDVPYVNSSMDNKVIIKNYLNTIISYGFKYNDFYPYDDEEKNEDKYYFCLRPIPDNMAKLLLKEYEWLSDEDAVNKINENNASKFLLELKDAILNPITEEDLCMIFDKEYKNELIKFLMRDINHARQKELIRLDSLPIGYLTESEAKMIGKYDEWHRIYMEVFRITRLCLPTNIRIDLFKEELKIQGKNEFTPKMYADMLRLYENKSVEEIKSILRQRKKK